MAYACSVEVVFNLSSLHPSRLVLLLRFLRSVEVRSTRRAVKAMMVAEGGHTRTVKAQISSVPRKAYQRVWGAKSQTVLPSATKALS